MGSYSDTCVVILAAGHAIRLRPLSNRVPKPMIDIQGTPIITKIINNFIELGCEQFCVLIGYKEDIIKEEISHIKKIKVDFVEQKEPNGMADALLLCLDYLKSKYKNLVKKIFVTAADIVFSKQELSKMYELLKNTKADAVLSLMKSKDEKIAEGHGNVKISPKSDLSKEFDAQIGLEITDIIEKPKKEQILSDYYSLPLYLFSDKIHEYLKAVKKSVRGEKELQDAIKILIKNNDKIVGINVIKSIVTIENVGKYHLTFLKDIIKMNNRFFANSSIDGYDGDYPTFIEPITLKLNVRIGDTALLGPNVIVNKNCEIGAFTELANTILYEGVIVGKHCKLNWCIVDKNVKLSESFQANNCFISKNDKNEIEITNFQ